MSRVIVLLASVSLLVGAVVNVRRAIRSPQSLRGNVGVLVVFAGAVILFFALS